VTLFNREVTVNFKMKFDEDSIPSVAGAKIVNTLYSVLFIVLRSGTAPDQTPVGALHRDRQNAFDLR
jgi:hypothetical protein